MYKKILKPVFFLFHPETIHRFICFCLKLGFKIPGVRSLVRSYFSSNALSLQRNVFGLDFPNPVGLAAGFDKNGEFIEEYSSFGFGFIEIGTVTPLPQPGNPKPRNFRLPEDEAIINRMGFNNDGAVKIANRLRNKKRKIIVGGNIGKNKSTPIEEALNDYEKCFSELYDVVDYFVVNVSSPNTPGLRELQEKEPLKKILTRLQEINMERSHITLKSPSSGIRTSKPILLKISPDLTNKQLDDIIEIVLETRLAGIVATNTTVSRENLLTPESRLLEIGAGGLSGKPIRDRSTEVIHYLAERSEKKFSIIGVGGISSPDDAIEKIKAGAELIQIYTGFVYEGPGLVKKINQALCNMPSRTTENSLTRERIVN